MHHMISEDPAPGSVMILVVNWSKSNSCLAMYRYKRPRNTWDASSDSDRRLMIGLESSHKHSSGVSCAPGTSAGLSPGPSTHLSDNPTNQELSECEAAWVLALSAFGASILLRPSKFCLHSCTTTATQFRQCLKFCSYVSKTVQLTPGLSINADMAGALPRKRWGSMAESADTPGVPILNPPRGNN